MGRQRSKAIYIGTCANLNGYIDDGRPIARLVDRKDRRQKGAKSASKLFGKVSKAAAKTWLKLPQPMRRLGGEGTYNQWISTCLDLANEGSYHWDWSQLENIQFGVSPDEEPTLKAPTLQQARAALKAGTFNLSALTQHTHTTLAGYREGRDANWRLAAMPRRAGHYDLGNQFNPYRGPAYYYEGSEKDKAWNAKNAKGIYKGYDPEYTDHFPSVTAPIPMKDGCPIFPRRWENFRNTKKKGKPLPQGEIRVRYWLHLLTPDRRSPQPICTPWTSLDAKKAPSLDLNTLKETIKNDWDDTSEALIFIAQEVSEKRLRHWVRLPFACALTLVGHITKAQVLTPHPKRTHTRSSRSGKPRHSRPAYRFANARAPKYRSWPSPGPRPQSPNAPKQIRGAPKSKDPPNPH
jgi:hypothetical protein